MKISSLFLFALVIFGSSALACNSTKIEPFGKYKMLSERCESGNVGPDEEEVGDIIPGQWLMEWGEKNRGATVEACDGRIEARIPNRNYCGDGDLVYRYQLVTNDHGG